MQHDKSKNRWIKAKVGTREFFGVAEYGSVLEVWEFEREDPTWLIPTGISPKISTRFLILLFLGTIQS